MSASDSDPTIGFLKKLTESYRSVKFGSGVIGKTNYISFGLVSMWSLIAFRLSNEIILNSFLGGAGLIATAFGVWAIRSTQDFAQRNPAQAILEGADFIEYQKFEAQAKGGVLVGSSSPVEAPKLTPSINVASDDSDE